MKTVEEMNIEELRTLVHELEDTNATLKKDLEEAKDDAKRANGWWLSKCHEIEMLENKMNAFKALAKSF